MEGGGAIFGGGEKEEGRAQHRKGEMREREEEERSKSNRRNKMKKKIQKHLKILYLYIYVCCIIEMINKIVLQ